MDYQQKVTQIFQIIKSEYELYGKIEVEHKELLLKKMKEVEGGEMFAHQMLQAFEEMENSDDSDDNDDSLQLPTIAYSGGRNRERSLRGSKGLNSFSHVQSGGTRMGKRQPKTKATTEDPKIRRRKVKFDIALTVFNLFKVKCHFESTCEEVFGTTSNND